MADTDNRVELTDLDVIARYSLAVRAATADRDELIATLRADLDWLQGGRSRRASSSAAPARRTEPSAASAAGTMDRRAPAAKKATAAKATSGRSTTTRKPVATKSAAKKSAASKSAAKKSAAKKATRRR